jgi:hypothetical protein
LTSRIVSDGMSIPPFVVFGSGAGRDNPPGPWTDGELLHPAAVAVPLAFDRASGGSGLLLPLPAPVDRLSRGGGIRYPSSGRVVRLRGCGDV